MSLLRASRLITTSRAQLQIVLAPTGSPAARRTLASTAIRQGGDAHGSHLEPPGGWLFGVKPGEKPEPEGWENIWFYGFFGTILFGVVGYAYKPDTSIQTWALEEARRRLEAEGILEDPEKKR